MTAFFAIILMLATQIIKHAGWGKYVNPLLIAGGLSLVGGIAYATLYNLGYWDVIWRNSTLVFSGSVTIYATLLEAFKMIGADVTPLKQPTGDAV